MIRKRLGRLATVLTSAALASTLLGIGVVTAATPVGWGVDFVKLPTVVSADNEAGWFVTVWNHGPSNVNDQNIILTSEVAGALPSYLTPEADWFLSSGGTASCSAATGVMVCNVGTLADDQYVTFTVAFHVPAGTNGSFDLNVNLRAGTGDTGSDRGHNSRGDDKTFTSSTDITSSTNQDAGFVVDATTDGSFQTTGNLGRNNKQTTALQTTDEIIPVTVTDGVPDYPCNSSDADCTAPHGLIGEWSVLNVNGGDNLDPIKVTIMIWGGSVPGGASVDEIYLLHADGLGGATPINTTCDSATAPTNADCLVSVTKVGNNFRIIAWLEHNGGLRGIY